MSRAEHPGIEIPDDEFAAYLGARDAADAPCRSDLYFACAVMRGDPIALRRFETEYIAELEPVVARVAAGTAILDDVRNAIRERVLPHGGKGKLSEYHGRGDLRGWLRVVAVREALQIVRSRRREAPMPDDLLLAVEPPTPSDEHVYREAFTRALATLTARERNLLRQHYLHTATVAEIGALYGVHGATAARWIAQIRATLLERTRRVVSDALHLTGDDLDSAMAKVDVDYSLRHTLSNEH